MNNRIRLSDIREMGKLLTAYGYDPEHAGRLSEEGMGPYELTDRLRHPPGTVGSLEYTHNIKPRHSKRDYLAFVRKYGSKKIPDRGFCISARRGGGYDACFLKKRHALVGARKLADDTYETVDVVQVQNHGNDRFIIAQVEPRRRRRS